jgi:hypothetical protein
MPIDISKLENVKKGIDGKIVSRCPACAEHGKDTTGNHLVMYPDGKYGCVAYPGDRDHRQAIFALCGVASGVPQEPKAIEIRVKSVPQKSGGIVLGRFGRVFQPSYITRKEKDIYIKEVEETRPTRPEAQPQQPPPPPVIPDVQMKPPTEVKQGGLTVEEALAYLNADGQWESDYKKWQLKMRRKQPPRILYKDPEANGGQR